MFQKSGHFSVGGVSMQSSQASPRKLKDSNLQDKASGAENNNVINDPVMQMIRTAQSQVSPANEVAAAAQNPPQPLQSPQNVDDNKIQNDIMDDTFNDQANNIRFGSLNGNIVPVGPSDLKTQSPNLFANQKEQINEEANNIVDNEQEVLQKDDVVLNKSTKKMLNQEKSNAKEDGQKFLSPKESIDLNKDQVPALQENSNAKKVN